MKILQLIARGRSRDNGPVGRAIVMAVAVGLAAMLLTMAFGVYIDRSIALFVFLGAMLALAFLTVTGNPLRPRGATVVSSFLAALSLAACLYFIIMADAHSKRVPMIDELSLVDMSAAIALVALVLEATRRCIGMTLVVLVSGFLAYGVLGHRLSGSFSHRALSAQEIVDHLVFSTNGLMGPALEVAAFLVCVFIVFGALLDRWGGGEFFHDLAQSLVGRQAGGPAKVAVFSSGLYGSISGSPTADVVTTGSFTIPLMIRTGVPRTYAAAVEATASTGGAILPPVMGSAAFLMVDFTGIPYATIVLAAIAPALLYYLVVFTAVHLQVVRRGLKPIELEGAPTLSQVLKRDWLYFVPIIVLIWGVLSLDRPVFAGAIACLALVPIGIVKAASPRQFVASLFQGLNSGMGQLVAVGIACAAAGLVVGTLSMADLTGKISSGMFSLAAGNYALTLFVACAVIILLGMGMPTPAVYALAAVLAAPALLALGVEMLPAHLFIVYFASLSAITPPVAVAAFAAASIARANPIAVAFLACRVGVVAFVCPLLFISQTGLLMIGDATTIVSTIVFVTMGSLALVATLEGYLRGALGAVSRVALFAISVGLLLDTGALRWGFAAAACVIFVWRSLNDRPRALAGTTE
ncbi:MAG: TRAP transporter fused permease subunit [Burkholderiaceae bacterium]|nr:TRAP transporter fused permease subunit [Burkholderiaceae bacterium]